MFLEKQSMDPIVYQLTFHDPAGNEVAGTISYEIEISKTDAATLRSSAKHPALALAETSGQTTEVGVFPATGTLNARDLTGVVEYPLQGLVYVSLMGPPIATIFIGHAGSTSISAQFNLIDSPGEFIGGALSWYPTGFGGDFTPWCFLGTRPAKP
jgi:hypothetical protein